MEILSNETVNTVNLQKLLLGDDESSQFKIFLLRKYEDDIKHFKGELTYQNFFNSYNRSVNLKLYEQATNDLFMHIDYLNNSINLSKVNNKFYFLGRK